MVKISVDEAYAFDILSIYAVKMINCTDPLRHKSSSIAYNCLFNELEQTFGYEKMRDIMNSKEYRSLFRANEDTFHLVDKIRSSNEVSVGKDIDNANMERFFCKRRLQEKFFEGKLLETKTQHE